MQLKPVRSLSSHLNDNLIWWYGTLLGHENELNTAVCRKTEEQFLCLECDKGQDNPKIAEFVDNNTKCVTKHERMISLTQFKKTTVKF